MCLSRFNHYIVVKSLSQSAYTKMNGNFRVFFFCLFVLKKRGFWTSARTKDAGGRAYGWQLGVNPRPAPGRPWKSRKWSGFGGGDPLTHNRRDCAAISAAAAAVANAVSGPGCLHAAAKVRVASPSRLSTLAASPPAALPSLFSH